MSKSKTMSIYFFNIRGTIHFEFVPERTTGNQTFYVEMSKKLPDATRHKESCGEIAHWFFITTHAGTFFATSVVFLAGKGTSAMDDLLYSPNLAPADFLSIKNFLHSSQLVYLKTKFHSILKTGE
jgi:hypothetical protein